MTSIIDKIRTKLRLRTRLRSLKYRTRVRTRYRDFVKSRYIKKESALKHQILSNSEGAILTLTGYFNYGNMLQRYALQRFLLNHGRYFVSYAQEPFDTTSKSFDRLRHAIPFVEQRIYRKQPNPSDTFSTYIAGSDQIWRKWGGTAGEDPFAELRYYFFDFIKNDNVKRIAYAASFGHADIASAGLDGEFMKSVKPLVKKMDAVSMRETSGMDIAMNWWGVKSELVVDPTMLLTKRDYSKLIINSTKELVESKPIFAYILESSKFRGTDLDRMFKIHDKPSEVLYLKEDQLLLSVEQWLKNIRDAELVVTDSFHGAVFSIIFNTPFIVIENSAGGISRIESLLKELGLEDRFLSNQRMSSYSSDMMGDIDWKKVNSQLDKLRIHSAKWLLSAVSK